MTVIHVTQQLNSDTLQLPELKPLIGKKVEITVREVAEQPVKDGWDALLELAGKDLIDLDAYKELRAVDRDLWREQEKMILVDTSVVIDQLRAGDPKLFALFKAHDAAICGLTRAEVLYGVRNQTDHSRFAGALNVFKQISIPDDLWDEAGLNLALLRQTGISVPLADAVLATLAIRLNIELWARDKHFPIMQSAIPGLRLFLEPP